MIKPINAIELTALVQRDYRNAAKFVQLQASEAKAKKSAFKSSACQVVCPLGTNHIYSVFG